MNAPKRIHWYMQIYQCINNKSAFISNAFPPLHATKVRTVIHLSLMPVLMFNESLHPNQFLTFFDTSAISTVLSEWISHGNCGKLQRLATSYNGKRNKYHLLCMNIWWESLFFVCRKSTCNVWPIATRYRQSSRKHTCRRATRVAQ